MKEPVDHIARPALPWRKDAPAITECGYDATKVKTITRDEYRTRLKELGQQRCAMFTCMTCAQTAGRYGTWDDDPRAALHREIEWEGRGRWTRDERGQLLKDELVAIAGLIEAHRDEFEASIQATEARREWLAKKTAHGHKPQGQTGRRL